MKIEFDEAKDRGNIANHGISLRQSGRTGSARRQAGQSLDYGEERFRAWGTIEGELLCPGVHDFVAIVSGRSALRRARQGRGRTACRDERRFDPDNPEWRAQDFAEARPPHEVLPPEVLAAFRAPGGHQHAPKKEAISIRLDSDVIEKFRSTGRGWQGRINEVLKRAKV